MNGEADEALNHPYKGVRKSYHGDMAPLKKDTPEQEALEDPAASQARGVQGWGKVYKHTCSRMFAKRIMQQVPCICICDPLESNMTNTPQGIESLFEEGREVTSGLIRDVDKASPPGKPGGWTLR